MRSRPAVDRGRASTINGSLGGLPGAHVSRSAQDRKDGIPIEYRR